MATVILDLPEAQAAWIEAVPESERNRYVTALLDDYEAEEELPPLSAEDREALLRSRADFEAGRVLPMETVLTDLRREFGLPPRPLGKDAA